MKFHPIISIILGTIIAFIIGPLIAIFNPIFIYIYPVLIGGFIATYFAKEKKTRYGIYVGIIIIILFGLPAFLVDISNYTNFLLVSFFVIIPAGIGGFLGKMTDENNRQTFKKKNLNVNFHPIPTVIIGIFVTFFTSILLAIMFDLNSLTQLKGISFIGGSLIGGFIATYFAKEKKIRYGIYVGIGVLIIEVLLTLYSISTGRLNPNLFNPVIMISETAGYLIAPTIGAYFGKIIDKDLKQNIEKTGV